MTTSDEEYIERAIKAWFRAGNTVQPSNGSGVYEAAGRRYVELWNTNGTLAVYRIENAGRLRRVQEWPQTPGAERRPMGYHLANNARAMAETNRRFRDELTSEAQRQTDAAQPTIGDVLRAAGITPRSAPASDDEIDYDDLEETLAELDRP